MWDATEPSQARHRRLGSLFRQGYPTQTARRKPQHRLRDLPLGPAVTLSLTTFMLAAFLVLYLLGRPWTNGWLHLGTENLPWKDRLLYAGGVVTLSGAVVALVVSYRKQRDTETGRFATAFAAAAQQLGDHAPSIRIAGVYALAALADRHPDRRQQCIDVLCGYLRLPYSPDAGAGYLTQRSIETTSLVAHTTTTDTHAFRADDREVRLTIIRTIRDHLQPQVPSSWQGHDFDFTGATFDGGDFRGAVFSGGKVDFAGAVFSGGKVTFEHAVFSGGSVDFFRAEFSGGKVGFKRAEFSGGTVGFNYAVFSGGTVSFNYAAFSLGTVGFKRAEISGGTVDFHGAEFTGATVDFGDAKFSGGTVQFLGAIFFGGSISFVLTRFSGGTVSFAQAPLSGGTVNFGGAKFSCGKLILGQRIITSEEEWLSWRSSQSSPDDE